MVRFGFRPTARVGAILALAGIGGLVAAAVTNASVAWVSAACGVIGAGLGPSSIAQVLAIQHVAPESQRGIATSLVPFFRTVGGSVGVGALGGTFAAGLAMRLGDRMEEAGRILAGVHASSKGGTGAPSAAAPPIFQLAIERSLVPVFVVLLGLAAINVLVAARFPELPARSSRAT